MAKKAVVRYALRLPPDLHAQMVQLAEKNHRSLNDELIVAAEESVKSAKAVGWEPTPSPPDPPA